MSGPIASIPTNTVGTPVLGGDVGRVNESRGKATPSGPTFGAVLASARPILKGAEAVASVLPGGPLVAAAVAAPGALAGGATGNLGMGAPMGGVAMSPRIGGAPGAASAAMTSEGAGGVAAAAGGGEGGQMQSVIADSEAFNLYYLQLQEQMSAENRQYSALSNVLKARHDTVKNAIGNIR